jgi:hypothetical protein
LLPVSEFGGSYQSLPGRSLPLGVQAAHQVEPLIPESTWRTLPSASATRMPLDRAVCASHQLHSVVLYRGRT